MHDLQIYGFCASTATQALLDQVAACISVVWLWMRSNRLQLNADKTESLWCAAARQQHLIPSSSLSVCSDYIVPSNHVRDLGIYIDSDMSVKTHVSCPAALLLYVRLRAYGAPSVNQFCCLWFHHWSCRDLITEALC